MKTTRKHITTQLICPESKETLTQTKDITVDADGTRKATIQLHKDGYRHAMCMPAFITTIDGKRVSEQWYKDGRKIEVPEGFEDMDEETKQFTWAML